MSNEIVYTAAIVIQHKTDQHDRKTMIRWLKAESEGEAGMLVRSELQEEYPSYRIVDMQIEEPPAWVKEQREGSPSDDADDGIADHLQGLHPDDWEDADEARKRYWAGE